MKLWSLRARLMFWSAAVTTVVLMLFSAGTAWSLRHRLVENLDRDLKDEAEDFFDTLDKHTVDWSQPRQVEYLFDIPKRSRLIEVTRSDGSLLYRSRNLNESVRDLPHKAGLFQTLRFQNKAVRFAMFQKGDVVLTLGQDPAELQKIVTSLLYAYGVALPLVLLAVGSGAWWISRQALAPIETIITRANSITARRLDERLPMPQAHDEIRRLTLVLNTMFDRLESSFQQVAQFTSDASHELKTPLAIMRGEIETAVQSGRFEGDQEKVLLSLLEEVTHLSKITANLLLLSRADAGKLQLKIGQVDVSALTSEIVEVMEIAAAARSVSIRAQVAPAVVVACDPSQFKQVLLNLLDNAIKYNHEGGTVKLTLAGQGNGTMALSIANTGLGIPAAQAQQVFQRFYRSEDSHNTRVEGHGLGLSICREIARAHGGSVELVLSDDQRTEFRLILPNASQGEPAAQFAQ